MQGVCPCVGDRAARERNHGLLVESSLRPIVGGLRGNNRALPPCPPEAAPAADPHSLELGRKGQGNRCASSRRRSSGHRSRASCALGVPAPHPIMIVMSQRVPTTAPQM